MMSDFMHKPPPDSATDTRNLFHLQCAGKMARASTEQQIKWLQNCRTPLDSNETIIAFERKFFLPRLAAQAIIDRFQQ